jgi:hypothetical protein
MIQSNKEAEYVCSAKEKHHALQELCINDDKNDV